MVPTYPTEPTAITLADGKTRHLRYSLGAVRRIKQKLGKDPLEILKTDPADLLPYVLMEGLIEKEGLTEQVILDELLTGPMIDYATFCFIDAFFGPRARVAFETVYRNQDAILARIATNETPTPEGTIQ